MTARLQIPLLFCPVKIMHQLIIVENAGKLGKGRYMSRTTSCRVRFDKRVMSAFQYAASRHYIFRVTLSAADPLHYSILWCSELSRWDTGVLDSTLITRQWTCSVDHCLTTPHSSMASTDSLGIKPNSNFHYPAKYTGSPLSGTIKKIQKDRVRHT